MFDADRTESTFASIERRAMREITVGLRKAGDALIESIPEEPRIPKLSTFGNAVQKAVAKGLRRCHREALAAGIVESDDELKRTLEDEGIEGEEADRVLGRPAKLRLVLVETTQLAEDPPTIGVAEGRLGVKPTRALKAGARREIFWSKRSGRMASRRIRKSLAGLLSGDISRGDAVRDIRRVMKITTRHARLVVRTETTWSYAAGRSEVAFRTRGVTHMRFRGVRDRRQSKICKSRNGKIFAKSNRRLIEANSPPLHGHCRSTWELILGRLPSQKKIVASKRFRPIARGKRGYVPLPKGWRPSSASVAPAA